MYLAFSHGTVGGGIGTVEKTTSDARIRTSSLRMQQREPVS